MKIRHIRQGLRAIIAAAGVVVLTVGSFAVPANAVESQSGVVVDIFGTDKYELAAELNGMNADELRELEAAGAVSITDDGFVLFLDYATEPSASSMLRSMPIPEGVPVPGNPEVGSSPDAPVTLAITFDDTTFEGQKWNVSAGVDPLILAGATGFTQEMQHEVWARVAELYAPFDINVIVGPQPDDVMRKTSPDDEIYGALAVVTDAPSTVVQAPDGLAGIAWMNGLGSGYLEGALVFASTYAGAPEQVRVRAAAETIAHEVGHNFALAHHGFTVSQTDTDEYYTPESGLWGPVMGISDYTPVSQWSDGSYAHATNPDQGDLEVITDRASARTYFTHATLAGVPFDLSTRACVVGPISPEGLQPSNGLYTLNEQGTCDPVGTPLTMHWSYFDRAEFAADTVGNTTADATSLDNTGGSFSTDGLILTRTDVDMYRFATGGGAFSATVDVANFGPSLNARLTLLDASGGEITKSEPEPVRVSDHVVEQMGAQITTNLAAGLYFLSVDGVGVGDPSLATRDDANGFSDYASIGNYRLSGTAAAFGPVAPLTIAQPASGAEVPGGKPVHLSGTAEPGATISVTLAGSPIASVLADAQGAWAASFSAIGAGQMLITVTQSVGGAPVADTLSLTLQAIAPDPSGGGSDSSGGGPATQVPNTQALSHTGASPSALPLVGTAAILLLATGTVLLWARKRHSTH